MNASALLAEIEQAGGKLWTEGDRLKFRAVPSRLVPAIREHKAELMALLQADSVEPLQPPVTSRSTTNVIPSPTMQPRASMAPSREPDSNAVPLREARPIPRVAPPLPEIRCADCGHVALANGQNSGVRFCNVTGTFRDLRGALIWGVQTRTCSRFETK